MHFFPLLKVIRAVSSSFLKKVIIWNAYTQKEIHQKNIVPYIGFSNIQRSNLLPHISKSITSFFLELM